MSIRILDLPELTDLYAQWLGYVEGLPDDGYRPGGEEMGRALSAAHRANLAAASMQYNDDPGPFRDAAAAKAAAAPDYRLHTGGARAQRQWLRALGNVTYNTTTNAGTDFLPGTYAMVLHRAEQHFLVRLAAVYAE